ncbi:hypothetical protein ACFXGY_13095, partial [Streptomyces sp. NPDC059346]
MTSVHTSAPTPTRRKADGTPARPIAWAMLSRAVAVPLILGLVCFLPAVIAAQPGAGVRDTA